MPPPRGNTLVAGSVISSSRFPQVEEGMVTSRAMTDAGGQASRIASLTAACGPIAWRCALRASLRALRTRAYQSVSVPLLLMRSRRAVRTAAASPCRAQVAG